MPFKPQDNLDQNPSVRIFFIGLNIIKSIDNDAVQVFIDHESPEHQLTIETRRKRRGKPDQLMMRIVGPLAITGADPNGTHGLLIKTTGLQSTPKGVRAYTGAKISTEGTKLADSFVLETLLGKSPGTVEQAEETGTIFIDHGVFYTADKITTKARLVKDNGGDPTDLTEVATIVGANIYLNPPDEVVTLFWQQDGKDVFLPLEQFPNSSYEIYVINEPLFEEISPTLPRHGEFEEYFKILPDVDPDDKFEIEFLEDIHERGSTRAPCMSIIYSLP